MIDEPKVEKASGGRLAAPLFAKIMANTLRIMDVAPDALPEMSASKSKNTKPEKQSVKSELALIENL